MTLFHKALAAALLCGAVGFAAASLAATTDASSSPAATTAEKSGTNATDTSTPAQPAKSVKRAARPRTAAVDEEHSIIEALNQKSLDAVQSGQTPDFASAEPASHQQAEAAKAAKTVVRHRTNTKASAKKSAG